MKFWQLIGIFRDEKSNMIESFGKPKWRSYLKYYNNLTNIVENQNREILDMVIDNDLLREISLKSKKVLYHSASMNCIYNYKSGFAEKAIPISEAIFIFDHNSVEEAFEKSESFAKPFSSP